MDEFATSTGSQGDEEYSLSTSHLVDDQAGFFATTAASGRGGIATLIGDKSDTQKQRDVMDKTAQHQRHREYKQHSDKHNNNTFYVPDGKKFRDQRSTILTREAAHFECSWCHKDLIFDEAKKCPHCQQRYFCGDGRQCQLGDWYENQHKAQCPGMRKHK